MKSFTQSGEKDGVGFRYMKVPTSAGEWIKRATGTKDSVTADQMCDMVETLASKHEWALLERITLKGAKTSVADLFTAWRATPSTTKNRRTGVPMEPGDDERIEHVRTVLNNVAIEPLLSVFEQEMKDPRIGMKARTLDAYLTNVRTFMPVGSNMTAADYTPQTLKQWTKDMKGVTPDTVLRRGRGMARFTSWLAEEGHLPFDPMQDVELPAPSDPLCHYIEPHEAMLLASRQLGQYKNFSAFLAGTGIEVSPALALRRRDVDVAKKSVFAPGTKNYNRKRVVRVAEWCWPYVLEVIQDKLPDALLFERVTDRYIAGNIHRTAVRALLAEGHSVFQQEIEQPDGTVKRKDYTMRDQRHTWAVYAVRGGWPLDAVSKQLGHANSVLVSKVYGRFVPTDQERDNWEAMASAAAKARREAIGSMQVVK